MKTNLGPRRCASLSAAIPLSAIIVDSTQPQEREKSASRKTPTRRRLTQTPYNKFHDLNGICELYGVSVKRRQIPFASAAIFHRVVRLNSDAMMNFLALNSLNAGVPLSMVCAAIG